MEDCFICRKHQGLEEAPAGGYIHYTPHWHICHAPTDSNPLGTLLIESSRHFLDPSAMNAGEQASYGPLLHHLYTAIKAYTDAARVYQLVFLEGVPHYHALGSYLAPPTRRTKPCPFSRANTAAPLPTPQSSSLTSDLLHSSQRERGTEASRKQKRCAAAHLFGETDNQITVGRCHTGTERLQPVGALTFPREIKPSQQYH